MLIDVLNSTFSSIWSNKVRSLLTMLGMIIGVSSVVTLMSIGQGVKDDVAKMVQGLGSNVVFVLSGNIDVSGGSKANVNPANLVSGDILKTSDVTAISKIAGIDKVAPMSLVPGSLKYKDISGNATIVGTTEASIQVLTGLGIDKGRMISDVIDNKKHVVVLGSDTAKALFGENNPIGEKVNIGLNQFEVIGTLKAPESGSALGGNELSAITIMPYSTSSEILGRESIYRIALKVKDNVDVKNTVEAVKADMLTRHAKDDFSVFTQEDLLGLLGTFLNLATAMVSAIAAIALIVGGIGIMNIMLVTVTERTREIGIRKAVGATPNAILWQFLAEAITVSLLGGLIGLGLSTFAIFMVEKYSPITPSMTITAIMLALGVSFGVGIIFGLAPAIRAARKDPIDALRYE